DPDAERGAGVDCDGPHRHASRHAGSGASGSGAVEARSARRRSLPLPRARGRSGEDPLARRRRAVALRQAARPGKFIWPSAKGGVVSISPAQMAYMLEGIDWRNPQLTWRPKSAGERLKTWGRTHFGAPR